MFRIIRLSLVSIAAAAVVAAASNVFAVADAGARCAPILVDAASFRRRSILVDRQLLARLQY